MTGASSTDCSQPTGGDGGGEMRNCFCCIGTSSRSKSVDEPASNETGISVPSGTCMRCQFAVSIHGSLLTGS